jgi:zinc transporter ZupT
LINQLYHFLLYFISNFFYFIFTVGKSDKVKGQSEEIVHTQSYEDVSNIEEIQHGQWKRIILLVIAITVHNIPEGLAVGVGFGAIGSSTSATFESAR